MLLKSDIDVRFFSSVALRASQKRSISRLKLYIENLHFLKMFTGYIFWPWNCLTSETFVFEQLVIRNRVCNNRKTCPPTDFQHIRLNSHFWITAQLKFASVRMKVKANRFGILGSISLPLNILYLSVLGHAHCKFLNMVWHWMSVSEVWQVALNAQRK